MGFDEALFAPGDAQACAFMITRAQNKVTDVFQWCRKEDVNLQAKTSQALEHDRASLTIPRVFWVELLAI
jgi:hypothetical protein